MAKSKFLSKQMISAQIAFVDKWNSTKQRFALLTNDRTIMDAYLQ